MTGIAFDQMPAGCTWTYGYSDGYREVHTFLGMRDGHFTVQTTDANGGNVVLQTFDAEGELIRKTKANGAWDRFMPHACYDVPGPCRYVQTGSNGFTATHLITSTPRGAALDEVDVWDNGRQRAETVVTFGPYHIVATMERDRFPFRLIGIANCNLNS